MLKEFGTGYRPFFLLLCLLALSVLVLRPSVEDVQVQNERDDTLLESSGDLPGLHAEPYKSQWLRYVRRATVPSSAEAHRDEALRVRGDTPAKGTDLKETVLRLWSNPRATKVPVNNEPVVVTLDPAKDLVFTTGACFGCTFVALCSGTMCVGIHFRENNGPRNPWAHGQDEAFELDVVEPLEAAMDRYRSGLGPAPLAVVFTPGTQNGAFRYGIRIQGEGSIDEAIRSAFPQVSVLNIGYAYTVAFADMTDEKVAGKIVLEWRGGSTACAERPGVSTLNVFAEDTWHRSLHFDKTGNSVSAKDGRCQIP